MSQGNGYETEKVYWLKINYFVINLKQYPPMILFLRFIMVIFSSGASRSYSAYWASQSGLSPPLPSSLMMKLLAGK